MVEMDDVLRDTRNDLPIGEAFKVFHHLSELYDAYIVCREDPNKPELWGENLKWAEAHIGVPAWNRVLVGNHPELLMGDYLLTRAGLRRFPGHGAEVRGRPVPHLGRRPDFLRPAGRSIDEILNLFQVRFAAPGIVHDEDGAVVAFGFAADFQRVETGGDEDEPLDLLGIAESGVAGRQAAVALSEQEDPAGIDIPEVLDSFQDGVQFLGAGPLAFTLEVEGVADGSGRGDGLAPAVSVRDVLDVDDAGRPLSAISAWRYTLPTTLASSFP
jgi:hypothetical protein